MCRDGALLGRRVLVQTQRVQRALVVQPPRENHKNIINNLNVYRAVPKKKE